MAGTLVWQDSTVNSGIVKDEPTQGAVDGTGSHDLVALLQGSPSRYPEELQAGQGKDSLRQSSAQHAHMLSTTSHGCVQPPMSASPLCNCAGMEPYQQLGEQQVLLCALSLDAAKHACMQGTAVRPSQPS
jgi:hypothetical protein